MTMKRLLVTSIVILALAIIGLVVAISMVDLNKHKPQIAQIVKEKSGYDIKIKGDISVSFFPVGLRVNDVALAKLKNKPFVTLKEFNIVVKILPLLASKIKVDYLLLDGMNIDIKKYENGKFNYEVKKSQTTTKEATSEKEVTKRPLLDVKEVKIQNVYVSYFDEKTKAQAKVEDFDLLMHNIAYDATKEPLHAISFTGQIDIKKISYNKYNIHDTNIAFTFKDAIAKVTSMTYNLFDSHAKATATVDLNKKYPYVKFAQNIPKLKLVNFSKEILEKELLDGEVNFDLKLATTLNKLPQKNIQTTLIFDGQNIGIKGYDIDKIVEGYSKSQGIDVVDIGSFLVAGPVGLALSKSTDGVKAYSGLKSGRTLLKHLHIKIDTLKGKANLSDVALATGKNRIAIKGSLDLVQERFVNAKVGVLDKKSCAKYSQTITGALKKPSIKIDESTVDTVVNITSSLFGKGKKLLKNNKSNKCKLFYKGVVSHP